MQKEIFILFNFCILLQSLVFAQSIKTVFIANTTSASNMTIGTTPSSSITFDLNTIPISATIDSCKLLLVCATNITNKTMLDITLAQGTFPDATQVVNNNKRICYLSLDKGVKQDSVLRANVNPAFISKNLYKTLGISLKVHKNTLTFANKSLLPGNCPRLVVYYTLKNYQKVEWAGAQGDAQHQAQTATNFGGIIPTGFTCEKVTEITNNQQDLVMYKNKIYVAAPGEINALKAANLYAIEPNTKNKTRIATNLDNSIQMPVIDYAGRLYYISENKVSVFDLNNGNAKTEPISISGMKTIKVSPTIGKDGTLYLVLSNIICAYSPFPQHRLLWQYSLSGDKSPLTLNPEGTIAYVASYTRDTLYAINTNNGRKIGEVAVALAPVQNEGATIPLVNNKGYIFVSNQLINATQISIFDKNLVPVNTIKETNLSRPIAGKDIVFWMNNGNLIRADSMGNTLSKVLVKASLSTHSLVTDLSNNAYVLGMDNSLYYIAAKATSAVSVKSQNAFQKALIIAPDGVLYTTTSDNLHRFTTTFASTSFATDYTLGVADKQNNNICLRGKTVNIPNDYVLMNKKILLANETINLGTNTTIDKAADITLDIGKGGISFKPGFRVEKGATLSCKTGY